MIFFFACLYISVHICMHVSAHRDQKSIPRCQEGGKDVHICTHVHISAYRDQSQHPDVKKVGSSVFTGVMLKRGALFPRMQERRDIC